MIRCQPHIAVAPFPAKRRLPLGLWAAALWFGLLAFRPFAGYAQRDIDLGRVTACKSCKLQPEVVTRLGDAEGPGIIESSFTRVVPSPDGRFLAFEVGGTSILRFDEDGRFLSRFGSKGSGPGELTWLLDVQLTPSRKIVAIDSERATVIVFDSTGRLLTEKRVDLTPGRFRMLGEDTLVIASVDRRPDLVGYPLHTWTLSRGGFVKHFGSTDGRWQIREPYSMAVSLGHLANRAGIWWGKVGQPHFEGWSADGTLMAVVSGELDWFPPVANTSTNRRRPWTVLTSFAVDSRDRLWMMTMVPDPEWRAVELQGQEGLVQRSQYDEYWDSRVDVIDLNSLEHLGNHVWDSASVSLFGVNGDVLASAVQLDDDLIPRVVLYRFPSIER